MVDEIVVEIWIPGVNRSPVKMLISQRNSFRSSNILGIEHGGCGDAGLLHVTRLNSLPRLEAMGIVRCCSDLIPQYKCGMFSELDAD